MKPIKVFPAPAGVIPTASRPIAAAIGFPRTCGGDPGLMDVLLPVMVFPAPAGVILEIVKSLPLLIGFPRTCGGDPYAVSGMASDVMFSPHLRG